MINDNFDPGFINVVEGGAEAVEELLKCKFDHIFFTGGIRVGKIIAGEAAKTLTPVTLELGGKSPCIVDEEIDMKLTAKRIVWGKFFNAGQSCVAPDYLLVHRQVKQQLFNFMTKYIRKFYGNDPKNNPDYPRIINERHFSRLVDLLKQGQVVLGGGTDSTDCYIEPTIMENVSLDDEIMESEIFGPILPVVEFSHLDQAIEFVNSKPKPLASYIFSKKPQNIEKFISRTSSGGTTVNDTLLHLSSPYLPFGGVGESGIGRYHGKSGFDAFSNKRAVLSKPFFLDLWLRYPPYSRKFGLMKRVLNFLP